MVNTVLGPMVYLYANNYAQEFVPVHFSILSHYATYVKIQKSIH